MATGRVWNEGWLSENSQRKYPLMDTVTGTDSTGEFVIPDTFMLDLSFPVPISAASNPGGFHIMQVAAYTGGYVITLGYVNQAIGSFSIVTSSHTWGKQYPIIGQGDCESCAGFVAIGNLDEINSQPPGVFTFTTTTAALQPRCIIPTAAGIGGMRIRSGGVLSGILTGLVTLEEGTNVRLNVDTATNTIKISAVGSDDFTASCSCTNQRVTGDPIRTINGVSPNSSGNITLTGAACISLEALTSGFSISDSCATPCCGCDELEIVNTALSLLKNQQATLTNYANRLEATANSINGVISQTIERMPTT